MYADRGIYFVPLLQFQLNHMLNGELTMHWKVSLHLHHQCIAAAHIVCIQIPKQMPASRKASHHPTLVASCDAGLLNAVTMYSLEFSAMASFPVHSTAQSSPSCKSCCLSNESFFKACNACSTGNVGRSVAKSRITWTVQADPHGTREHQYCWKRIRSMQ